MAKEEKKVEAPVEETPAEENTGETPVEEPQRNITPEEFQEIVNTIENSGASIDARVLVNILRGIVKDSKPGNPGFENFVGEMTRQTFVGAISTTVVFSCNSVLLNLWNMFGKRIKELYDESQKKLNEEAIKSSDVN